MFKPYPRNEGDAKNKVKEAFVGNGKDDEGGRKGEEDDGKAMEVVAVGLHAVKKGYRERSYYV